MSDSLRDTLTALESEKAKIEAAIEAIKKLIDGGTIIVSPEKVQSYPQKRNRPGIVRDMIIQVLKDAGKPLAPVEIRDALIQRGAVYRDKRNMYSTIFNVLKREPSIKKTKEGFMLKS